MTLRLKLTPRIIVKKNSQRIMRLSNGRRFIAPSLAFKKFKSVALNELSSQTYGMTFKNTVSVEYTFFLKGKIDSDIDNMIASINDILMDSLVLKDDSLITEITARKVSGCRDFETEIIIEGAA